MLYNGLVKFLIQAKKAVEENKDSSLLFAYLAMNNFDISKLEKQVETKTVSKLRDKLSNYSDTRQKLKGAQSKIIPKFVLHTTASRVACTA